MDEAHTPIETEAAPCTAGRRPVPARTKALLGLLAFMCVTFGVNSAHVYALEQELAEIAQEKAQLEIERAEHLGVAIETAYLVTATKEYLIYGDVQGKIEVFVKKPDPKMPIVGLDYFMARNEGAWTLLDSSACTDESCQIRGAKAFAAR